MILYLITSYCFQKIARAHILEMLVCLCHSPKKAVVKREISIKCRIRLRKGEMRCWDYRSERLLSWDC